MKHPLLALVVWMPIAHASDPTEPALAYRSTLVAAAQFAYGMRPRVPMFAGQIFQESSWRSHKDCPDGGRGLAQFMDDTAKDVVRYYPELGAPDPYNPKWAILAMVRYDQWIYARVKGATPCERWAATLKGYNAGYGYVQRAQQRSSTPGVWFGVTERINAGQSDKNFEFSRQYPRLILFKHQPKYLSWEGERTCNATP